MSGIELLAPAGSFDCLMAAVQSGADAVYLSGKKFGARSYANNFDYDELKRAVEYCHLRNTDVHVTVNTLMSDRELGELSEYIEFLTEIGVDAVIVQDIGAFEFIKAISPNLPIHASTQMTVHNLEGVLKLERLGASRVVLSRELSLEEIEHIVSNCNVEIEVFGHGAICMSYSGQCLISSMLGGRSGNRGKCAQPCRLAYSVNGSSQTKTYLSPKDMISLYHLAELKRIGVSSLKIEGRMKGVSYVSAVVDIYRKYLDDFHAIEKADINTLNEIFYRGGLTDGYFTGKKGTQMFALDKPDNPYQKNSKETIEKYNIDYSRIENRLNKIDISAKVKTGEKPELKIQCGDVAVQCIGENTVDKASRAPLSYDNLYKQLTKLGGTPFEVSGFNADFSEDAFISVKELNELRRNAITKLTEEMLKTYVKYERVINNVSVNSEKDNNSDSMRFTCSVLTREQFEIIKNYDFYRIYVSYNLLCENPEYFAELKDRIVIVLPTVIKNFEDYKAQLDSLYEMGFENLRADNIGTLMFCDKFKVYGGFRLNVFNSMSMDYFAERAEIVALSPEMNLSQIRDLRKQNKAEIMAYGRIPLMITENCIIKNANGCPCNGTNYITDRKGMNFPVIKDDTSCISGECRNVVLNSLPLFMGDKMHEIKRTGASFARLDFTVESKAETENICEIYLNGANIKEEFEYTRAYFNKRTVE